MEWKWIISFLGTLFAIWYAARSVGIAKKAYSLALEQDKRNCSSLGLSILDSYIERIDESDERLFVFHLMITNNSASKNSIKDIRLRIEYQKGDGPFLNVSIPHNPNLKNKFKKIENPLKIPLNIDSYSTINGSAIFKLSNEMIRGACVDTYMVTIIDNSGQATELEASLLQETDNDKMA